MPEVPPLLHERLEAQYGAELAREIEAGYVRKRTTFRVNPLKGDHEAVLREIAAAGITVEPIAWYADAFLLPDADEDALRALPCYEAGAIYLQSLSSMLPALVLAPQAGETVLDMAAAPGGKTTQMAALSGGKRRKRRNGARHAVLLQPHQRAGHHAAADEQQHDPLVIAHALRRAELAANHLIENGSRNRQHGGNQRRINTKALLGGIAHG